MGEEKDHEPKIIMHNNANKSGFNILEQLVTERTCTRSTRHWRLKLFRSFIDVASVKAFVLWILTYPNGQQKKNQWTRLYLYLLTYRVMRAIGIPFQQAASPTTVKKSGGRQLRRCSTCPAAKDRRTGCSEWVCENHTVYTDWINCDNCQEQSNKLYSHFRSKIYFLVLKKCYVFHPVQLVAWEMKNLNKSFFSLSLPFIESKNQT